ncbi:translation initiation factor IF-2-like isoform X1 [Gallus gallus]|uniref:translation initiation factor IF-2-like isoform X1 n=1 Tax=Gallus gallus TaxID=9031 RepID=UPI001AE53C2D|nr:translation initiation factor IF-2-like isoform X1 [Gallus gallus]
MAAGEEGEENACQGGSPPLLLGPSGRRLPLLADQLHPAPDASSAASPRPRAGRTQSPSARRLLPPQPQQQQPRRRRSPRPKLITSPAPAPVAPVPSRGGGGSRRRPDRALLLGRRNENKQRTEGQCPPRRPPPVAPLLPAAAPPPSPSASPCAPRVRPHFASARSPRAPSGDAPGPAAARQPPNDRPRGWGEGGGRAVGHPRGHSHLGACPQGVIATAGGQRWHRGRWEDRHLSSPADGKVLSKPDTGCSPQWPPKEEGEGAGLQVGSQSCPLQGKSKEASVLMRLRMGCYRHISHYIYCSTKTRNGVLLVSEDTQIL